jgi:hypothetical protein
MVIDEKLLFQKAEGYASRHAVTFGDRLGDGMHGIVLVAESKERVFRSAIKIFRHSEPYWKERDVYLRLREGAVERIAGFNVPQLLAFDDELLAIAMTIVAKPYVLDFAGAFLDTSPEFPEDVLADWLEQKREQFGSRWPTVESVLRQLRSQHGIILTDVSPGNIAFLDAG